MSELKYKVGDKVRIKSLDWYHHNKDGFGGVYIGDKKPKFTYAMSKYCGQVLTVDGHFEYEGEYYMIEDDGVFTWTDEMFEGVVKDGVNGEYYLTPIYFVRPNGYQFVDENGNEILANKIILTKKKTEEKYSDVKIQIFGNVVILKGGINADNPTEYMNEVVDYILNLLGKPKYNQFIEDYLDNPWVRILIFDFNSMKFNNSFDDIVTNFKQ